MTIVGAEDLTSDQIHQEILRGGKFVIYQFLFRPTSVRHV